MESNQSVVLMVSFIVVTSLGLLIFIIAKICDVCEKKNCHILSIDEARAAKANNYSCPVCQQAMKNGYAVAPRGIIWREEGSKPIGVFTNIGQVLRNTVSFSIVPKENQAWHCDTCQVVVVDHSALIVTRKK